MGLLNFLFGAHKRQDAAKSNAKTHSYNQGYQDGYRDAYYEEGSCEDWDCDCDCMNQDPYVCQEDGETFFDEDYHDDNQEDYDNEYDSESEEWS